MTDQVKKEEEEGASLDNSKAQQPSTDDSAGQYLDAESSPTSDKAMGETTDKGSTVDGDNITETTKGTATDGNNDGTIHPEAHQQLQAAAAPPGVGDIITPAPPALPVQHSNLSPARPQQQQQPYSAAASYPGGYNYSTGPYSPAQTYAAHYAAISSSGSSGVLGGGENAQAQHDSYNWWYKYYYHYYKLISASLPPGASPPPPPNPWTLPMVQQQMSQQQLQAGVGEQHDGSTNKRQKMEQVAPGAASEMTESFTIGEDRGPPPPAPTAASPPKGASYEV